MLFNLALSTIAIQIIPAQFLDSGISIEFGKLSAILLISRRDMALLFSLSSRAPLTGDAGLGSLSSIGMRYLGSEGQVCQNFCKDYQVRLIG